jgi:ribonuclease R
MKRNRYSRKYIALSEPNQHTSEKIIKRKRGAAVLDNQEKEINIDMKNKLLSFMKEDAYKPLSYNELIQEFQGDFGKESEFDDVLNSLLEDGSIIITRKNKYGVTEKMNLVPGRLQGNKKGFGFLIPDNKDICDLFIPLENLNGAMNNDRVIVRLTSGELGTRKSEGEVIKILKHANEKIVGTFENGKGFGFVVPDDPRIQQDVFVSKSDFNGAKDGDKVVVDITKWPEARRNPEGIVIEVLGNKDDAGTDII